MSAPNGNSSTICRYWVTKGWCGFGSKCKFLHTSSSVGGAVQQPMERREMQADERASNSSRSLGKRPGSNLASNTVKKPRNDHAGDDSGGHSSSRKRP
eukprot:3839850-Rhodomonas_salina.1